MAEKKIIGAVRFDRTLYVEGDEDKLASAKLPKDDLIRLEDEGVIEGYSGRTAAQVEKARTKAEAEGEAEGEAK